jgi:hypothetical protein
MTADFELARSLLGEAHRSDPMSTEIRQIELELKE